MTTPNTVDALAREISRWNFDATDTQILVCKDQHDKCAPCEYETLSPAEAVRIIDELRCAVLEASARALAAIPAAIDMLLYCPNCGVQHIDAPDVPKRTELEYTTDANGIRKIVRQPLQYTPAWTNPPHRTHLCRSCGCTWRPADVPTNGVEAIKTEGKADTWPAPHNEEVTAARAQQAGGVPAGFVAVPRIPTNKMLEAAQSAWLADTLRRTTVFWGAMLAAAPTQPVQPLSEAQIEAAARVPVSIAQLEAAFAALSADPRSAGLTTPKHWFVAGAGMAEGFHGIVTPKEPTA